MKALRLALVGGLLLGTALLLILAVPESDFPQDGPGTVGEEPAEGASGDPVPLSIPPEGEVADVIRSMAESASSAEPIGSKGRGRGLAPEQLTASIRVRVETESGEPLEGVELLIRAGAAGVEGAREASSALHRYRSEASTDADGRHLFRVPPFGVFSLQASLAGFARGSPLTVLPEDELTIRLRPGTVLEGRVSDEVSGLPLAGARVALLRDSQRVAAVSGEDGWFRILDLEPDSYRVEVLAEGYDLHSRAGVLVEQGSGSQLLLELRPGTNLVGAVLDRRRGTGIAGAEVVLLVRQRSFDGQQLASTTTDAAGGFRFERISRRGLEASVRAEGFAERRVELGGTEIDGEIRVEVPMVRGAQLSGTVRDANGQPVAGADLRLEGAERKGGRSLRVEADQAGRFAFEGVLPGVPQRLLAADRAGAGTPVQIEGVVIPADESITDLEVILEQGARIRGLVVDGSGAPVPNAMVALEGISQEIWRALRRSPLAVSDAEGMFEYSGLPGEQVTLTARSGSLVSQTQETTISSGGLHEPTLVLDEGAVLLGSVVDHLGAPVTGALVTVFSIQPEFELPTVDRSKKAGKQAKKGKPVTTGSGKDKARKQNNRKVAKKASKQGSRLREKENERKLLRAATGGRSGMITAYRGTVRSDETGLFRLGGLQADERLVLLVRRDGFAARRVYDVRWERTEPRIVIARLVPLTGVVVDADSRRPVRQFQIRVRPVGDPEPPAADLSARLARRRERSQGFRSAEGSFRLENLEPGAYDVTVHASGYRGSEPTRIQLGPVHQPLLLELVPTTLVHGRVSSRGGAGISGIPVFLVPVGAGKADPPTGSARKKKGGRRSRPLRRTADRQGRFSFGSVRPGRYRIGLGTPGQPLGEPQELAVSEGERITRELRFDAVGSLTLVVRGELGFGLGRARVKLKGSGTRSAYEASTDGSGRVSFGNIVADDYRLTISARGHKRATENISVRIGNRDAKTFSLQPSGS